MVQRLYLDCRYTNVKEGKRHLAILLYNSLILTPRSETHPIIKCTARQPYTTDQSSADTPQAEPAKQKFTSVQTATKPLPESFTHPKSVCQLANRNGGFEVRPLEASPKRGHLQSPKLNFGEGGTSESPRPRLHKRHATIAPQQS